MTETGRLRATMESVAKRILADFEASGTVEHRGSKGTLREDTFRTEFLERYLTRTVSVLGSGEVVATNGDVSGQCDTLIVDPATPPLYDQDGYRVVPAECVDATIEVKSNLTVEELRKSWAAARKLKQLPKTAFIPQPPIFSTTTAYGRTWDYRPTNAFIFAYDGASLETLGKALAELRLEEPDPALRIDGVYILQKGMLLWTGDRSAGFSLSPISTPMGDLTAIEAEPAETLLTMLLMLNKQLAGDHYRVFDPVPYVTGSLGFPLRTWSFVE